MCADFYGYESHGQNRIMYLCVSTYIPLIAFLSLSTIRLVGHQSPLNCPGCISGQRAWISSIFLSKPCGDHVDPAKQDAVFRSRGYHVTSTGPIWLLLEEIFSISAGGITQNIRSKHNRRVMPTAAGSHELEPNLFLGSDSNFVQFKSGCCDLMNSGCK